MRRRDARSGFARIGMGIATLGLAAILCSLPLGHAAHVLPKIDELSQRLPDPEAIVGELEKRTRLSLAYLFPEVDEPTEPSGLQTTPDTPSSIVSESHLYCMALAVYFEGGSTGESEEGQRHIARVIAERAKANERKWGGADVCDVVFYKRAGVCQFSFACLPVEQRTPKAGSRWDYSLAIARDELEGKSELEERAARYYMNPALTSDRNACRFRKELVSIKTTGRHEFFREPENPVERAALETANPEPCRRWQAALEAARRRVAKMLAEKKRKAQLAAKKQKEKPKSIRYAKR